MAFLYEEALAHLERAFQQGRLGHAYLISGPVHSHKRKLAAAMTARLLECAEEEAESHPDMHTAMPESKSRRIVVDQIREMEHAMHQKPLRGRRKVAVIYDADRLQPQAANAFLKTLEEPPPESHVFLVSSQPEMLLDTILSRCIDVPLRSTVQKELSAVEQNLLDALGKLIPRISQAGVQEAMLFTRLFQTALETMKAQILEQFEEELSHEKNLYKQNTDGNWLEEREEQIKARAEATVQRERSGLIHFIISVFGAALRQQQNFAKPLPPSLARTAEALAQQLSGRELIRRTEALDDLAHALERNVNEALALEAGFLRVFAPVHETRRH
jgi:DNA polymerase III subunit delta'